MAEIVGGVLLALTVSRNPVLVESVPSLTVTVIVAAPVCPATGVTVTVRLAPLPPKAMFASGTSVWFDEVPLRVRLATGVSTSPTVKAMGPAATPLVVAWLPIAEIVGASLTALTVSWKLALVLAAPSLTVRVIVVTPNWFDAGVIVTVRFAPLPPNTMLAFGTSACAEDVPLTVRLAAGVSASPTVKPMVLVGVSSLVTCAGTFEIVGGVLGAPVGVRNAAICIT